MSTYAGSYFTENWSTIANIKNFVLGIPILLSTFRSLLHLLPQIISIKVILMEQWRDNCLDKPSIRECSSNLEKLLVVLDHDNGRRVTFEAISKLLQKLPKLRTFWCTAFFCFNSDGKNIKM
ncbi:unnamed protein product, partial [Rotaria sp. Silwood2]